MAPPVIILGMHRSGTSCLTGCLEETGLYLGKVNQRAKCNDKGTRENLAFMELNDRVLSANGAGWDGPPAETVRWSEDHHRQRDALVAEYDGTPAWGFKDPRTVLTADGWLDALPGARLVATFRDPYAVAQSLHARNGFSIEKGLSLWSAYNERLLSLCEKHDIAVINYDWPADQYRRALGGVCCAVGLSPPRDGFAFFEAQMRRNQPKPHLDLPDHLRAVHRKLRYQARSSSRRWNAPAPPTARPLTLHSMRLFPKNRGADQYNVTGVAARCDWVVLSDAKAPTVHLRRNKKTDAPRHVFLSMRSPFVAITHFANNILPHLNESFVLVSGSEDATVPLQQDKRWRPYNDQERAAISHILDHPKLLHWFAENIDAGADERFSPLPTGMVYADGQLRTQQFAPTAPLLKQRPLQVFCAHRLRDGPQWETRKRVNRLARSDWAPFTTLVEEGLSEREFLLTIERHAFVLCVEGGGLDPSPKAWQAILHGAIPIIRRSPVSRAYEELPVVIVDEWRSDAITEKKLREWLTTFSDAFDTPAGRRNTLFRLGAEYWWSKIAACAR